MPSSKLELPQRDGPNFTYDKLLYLLNDKTKKIETIDELLNAIKKEYPEYLKFYTLVYDSLSLHEASFQYPRAIIFGPDAKLILTFNGEQKQRGFSQLEIMRFVENEGMRKFEFREITFKKEADKSISFDSQENYRISPPNGDEQKCLACHRASPRPIWDTYFRWPGVYGSNDDSLTFNSMNDHQSPYFNDGVEVTGFNKFNNERTLLDRYRNLPDYPDDRYSMDTNQNRPNLALTLNLSHLNYQRIVSDIQYSKALYSKRYQIIGALLCGNTEFSFAKDKAGGFLSPEATNIIEDTRKKNFDYEYYLIKRHAETVHSKSQLLDVDIRNMVSKGVLQNSVEQTGRLRFAVESSGVSLDEWSLPNAIDSFVIDNGNGSIWKLGRQMIRQLLNSNNMGSLDKKILSDEEELDKIPMKSIRDQIQVRQCQSLNRAAIEMQR